MAALIVNNRFKVIVSLGIALLVFAIAYRYVGHEVVIYENDNIDGYGFRASVTCRPDQMFTYYPYITIQTPNGTEVARSQIHGRGYEAFKSCQNSFPVQGLELVNRESGVRVYFKGRNAFGDADKIDVPIRFFSPR